MVDQHLLKPTVIRIDQIYIPAALRKPIDAKKVEEIATSIADIGQQSPILVRPDKERYVLVSGLHQTLVRALVRGEDLDRASYEFKAVIKSALSQA